MCRPYLLAELNLNPSKFVSVHFSWCTTFPVGFTHSSHRLGGQWPHSGSRLWCPCAREWLPSQAWGTCGTSCSSGPTGTVHMHGGGHIYACSAVQAKLRIYLSHYVYLFLNKLFRIILPWNVWRTCHYEMPYVFHWMTDVWSLNKGAAQKMQWLHWCT